MNKTGISAKVGNSVRMPGYTAEDSLYESSEGYRSATCKNLVANAAGVKPQLRPLGTGGKSCIPGCLCFTSKDCPCCDSLDDLLG